ncbi:MAG: SIR2 family protein [Bacteroidales bacterium]|nr:SIR2 family protein [Bacteroidales bacterium]
MDFKEALTYINLGNCILFTGSGFSKGATNSKGTTMPTGLGLAEILYNECNETSDGGDLQDASNLYIDTFGTSTLVRRLKELFTIEDSHNLTADQKYITSLPWKRIYTTNYDNIIELGYDCSGRKIFPKVLSDSLPDSDKTKLCVHLNGYIGRLDDSSLDGEFKLTDQSYTTEDFVESDWLTLFDSDLKTCDAIFFVGFSMSSDIDIKRIIHRDPEIYQKCYFIVYEKEKKPIVRTLENYGTVLPINTSGFVETYKQITPKPFRLDEKYKCFDIIKTTTANPVEIMDKDIHNLLTLGTVDIEKIEASINFPEKEYYINRTIVAEILERIDKGCNRLLIHSDIANGKTMLLLGLALHLSKKRYNVYFYNGYNYNINNEIEKICNNSASNIVFIVDNYSNNKLVLDSLKLLGQNSTIILSERSVINEVAVEWLTPKLGEFEEFDINKLSKEDRAYLIQILDNFGFWSAKATYDLHRKEQYVSSTCHDNIRNILLDLLKSKSVFDRFKSIINDIQGKQGYYEALLLMLIGKVFNIELDLDKVSIILGREKINSSAFRRNPTIAEFVNFDQGQIIVRSSLLAEIILSELSSTKTVVDLLIEVFKKFDRNRHIDSYRQALITFLSYTNLQRVLNKKDAEYNNNIYRFFESVKTLMFCRENPHFWLQYAILVLSSRDYDRADKYFETSYAFAKKNDYETFAIDNHYARFILENELNSGTHETCMEAFKKAHDILMNPIHKTKVRFYPYRVAQNYYPFYEKFYATMSAADKKYFLKCCNEINHRAKEYAETAESIRSKSDVRRAIKLLDQIQIEVSDEKGPAK